MFNVIAHTFNPNSWMQRKVDPYEFEASLVYLHSEF